MGVEREAKVTIRAEGDDEVARAATRIDSAWKSAGASIGGAFKGAGSAVAEAASSMLSDIGHVVTAAGAISFAGSLQGVHQLEESFARLGVGSGTSIRSVQDSINTLSTEINQMPGATAAWVTSVGQLTYSYEGAAEAAKGMAGYAALTGQSLQQTQGLAVTLAQAGVAGSDTAKAIGTIVAQAEQLKTVGGAKALGDEIQHLGSMVTSLGGDIQRTTALIAGFGGAKGFTPQQRERAMGAVLGKIEGDAGGFERFLGHKITDEFGHVTDMTGTISELQKYGKGGDYQRRRLEATFGREAMQAIMHTDIAAIRKAEDAQASTAPEHAQKRFDDTPAGQRIAAEIRKNQSMQKTVGADSALGGLSDMIGKLSGDHPILTTLGLSLGSKMLSAGARAVSAKLAGGAAAEGAGAAAGGGAAAEGAGAGTIAGGIGLGGVAALGGVALSAVAAKQGMVAKAITPEEAQGLAAKAGAATAGAGGQMSQGMQQAAAQERDAKQMRDTVAELVKAGASLQLAQETAKQLLAAGQKNVVIQVINETGGKVDAQLRGEQ